jgi:L-lactate dehydrogenase complex protein LldE
MIEVSLFIPCFVDQLYPQTGINMVKVLEAAGKVRVQYNPAQTCCGQVAYNAGFFPEATDVAAKFLHDFDTAVMHYIVAPSASCVGMVCNGYTRLLKDKPDLEASHQRIRPRTFEMSQFLVQILKVERIPGSRYKGRVAMHDSCSALRECNVYSEPRKLLANVAGLELVDLPDGEICCGFGGTFAVKFEAISTAMADQKIRNALSVGVDTLVSTDPSCVLHLDAYARKAGLPIKVMHIADVLAAGLGS